MGVRRGSAERGKREEGRGHSKPEPLPPKVYPGGAHQVEFDLIGGRMYLGVWKDTGVCKGLCPPVHSHARKQQAVSHKHHRAELAVLWVTAMTVGRTDGGSSQDYCCPFHT